MVDRPTTNGGRAEILQCKCAECGVWRSSATAEPRRPLRAGPPWPKKGDEPKPSRSHALIRHVGHPRFERVKKNK